MNRKITFPQLAEAMSRLTSVSPATAETFLKHLFEIIGDTLAKGEQVTIKGIGTFAPGDNPDTPVLWSPDKELAAAVNEPFAFFEAVPLGEGVTEDTLEEADSILDSTTEIAESTAEMPVIPPIPVTPPAPAIPPIPTPKTVEIQEETPAEETAADETPVNETHIEETTVEEPLEETTYDETTTYDDEPRRRFNPWLAFAIGVATGLLLYFIFDRYICADSTSVTAIDDAPALYTDTVADSDSVTVEPDSIKPTAAVDTVKTYEPIAIDTISNSRYLTTMARKYYGDYKFWVYIYEENSDIITNPNRIRPGTAVKIPDPEKYDIDKNDPESLHRAEKKIGEITARLAK